VLLQHEQRQTITQWIDPKIILANTILQLSSVELLQSIETELLENPALETLDDTPCAGDCIDPANCPYCNLRKRALEESERQNESLDIGDVDMETFYGTPDGDEEFDMMGNLEAEMTIQEHLLGLLRAAVQAEDYCIGEYLINSLDDRGWLDGTTETIALELNVPEADVQRVLEVIQSFDPPGVGARNVQECMLLQLRYLRDEEPTPQRNRINLIAEEMVREHFAFIAANRYQKLARGLGISLDEAKLAVEYIRTRLNPFPASQFRPPWAYRPTGSRSTVRPDVIIRRTELGYEVDVLGMDSMLIGINPVYREVYNQIKSGNGQHSEDWKKHVTEHVERAELFLRNLHQRRQTLRQITKCIIDEQTGFLETESRQFLRPLTRTRVARLLDIHESTVSRATANKFVQLPNQEVVSFNIFFNSSLSIKDAIEELIQDEDTAHPLSDQEIVNLLMDRGIHVARRTVVKYRESQKILSSTRRRR
jgi:RNA polymerase sigma-54 factor